MSRIELSVVVPIFDEESVLPLFVPRLRVVLDALGVTYEVVAVDDGSADLTPALLEGYRRGWSQLRVVRLRANAGHQAAISAGLARARGDLVVTIDADLQDPPEVIAEMLRVVTESHVDVVYGVRSDRSSDRPFKRASAGVFYRLISWASDVSPQHQAGDFRLMSRATVDAVIGLPERDRVLRLVVPALGFPSETVTYTRERRAAGESKYPFATMVKLGVDAFTGFSLAPLRLATALGLGTAVLSFFYGLYVVGSKLVGHTVPGWASTTLVVSSIGAVQLVCLGVMGEYIGRTYAHLQGRPTYFGAHDSLADRSLADRSLAHGSLAGERPGICPTCGAPTRSLMDTE